MVSARMTEQEAWELDDLVTHTEIKLGPNGTDFLSLRQSRLLGMDDMSVNYLTTKAEATHQSIGQIINALVREKITASA